MKILLSRRFRMVEDRRGGEVVLRASKGGSGVSGSILFHASLLMLVIGVFLGRYASMEATVALTEGQVFDASTDRFGAVTAGRFYAGGLSGLRFSLAAVDPAHVSGGASTAAVRILDLTGAGTAGARVVHVNRSASVSGFTLHLGTKTGYAPYIRVKNDAGRVLLDGFTRLAALGGGSLTRHRDLVWLEGEGSFLEAELLPGDGDRTPRSREAVPVLKISLHRMGAVSGPLVLLPGQTGDLMGHAVTFGDVRRWAHVDVSDDPSLPFLLIACLLGTAGLLVRLLWVRKEIVIRRRNHDGRTVFLVSGSAEKYPESFREEVLHIVGDIQAAAPSDVYIQHAAAAQAGTRPGARATVGGDA